MLRIDETSGTLVAPQAAGLVQESPPDREELLALVTSSWDAFAGRARPVRRAPARARARPLRRPARARRDRATASS